MTARTPDLRCYVVNLPRRQDRRAQIESQLPPGLQTRFTSDWPTEIDGAALDHRSIASAGFSLFPWRIESDNPWWSRPLKWGEVGCTIAHMACWRAATMDDVDYALVLEDDAVLVDGALDALHQALRLLGRPAPFDLLYLGRYPLEPDRPTAHAGIVVPGYSHCTFGYLLTRTGLRTSLDAGLDTAIVPIDEFLPALYRPHPRADLRERFPPQLRALAFDPPLITQRPKNEAGSDTEESRFVEQP